MTTIAPTTENSCRGSSVLPDLDQLLADARNRLAEIDPALPATFRVVWRGLTFICRLSPQSDSQAELAVHAAIGHLPFRAEDAARRSRTMALLEDGGAGRDLTIRATTQGVVAFRTLTRLDWPLSGGRILASLAVTLLSIGAEIADLQAALAADG